ncbi:MAG: carboxypeptidase regulatory-like domain-containing protein, partial [Gemmatimonadetes bacterium]|nr:carboxypeptidase regulatory-like domain-containing protein [Gemmatimonadota bacterium]
MNPPPLVTRFVALLWAVATGAALLGAPAEAAAQSRTTSALRGIITGPDAEAMIAATIVIRHQETGAERTALTNDRGAFLVLLLQPGGPYTLTVQALGFAEERREGLMLQVGEVTTINLELRVEALELEGVQVDVQRDEIFNPAQVGPATLLNERVVESMPILSRDITELALLSPLVKTTESGGFSVAGQNDRYNSLLIDGVLNKDMFGLTSGGVPGGQAGAKLLPLDAVTQYEVLVAPFDVRLSGFTGGVMNAVTRSGTNDWRVRAAAVNRNEALMGDLVLPTGSVEASGVDRSLFALSAGGPLVRDRGQVYIAAEAESRSRPPSGFNLFRDAPSVVRIAPDQLGDLQESLASQFDLDAGTGGAYALEQQLANVFARVDWNFPGGSRLTVRNIFSLTTNDESPNRSAFDEYELSSNGVERRSMSNTTSFQLFSPISAMVSNQLDLSVQRVTDETTPNSTFPQMEVEVISSIDDTPYQRSVRFGGEFFGQVNDLAQTTVRLTNALDIQRGDDVLTLGVTGAWYDIAHTFLPGAGGDYFFASVDDFRNNAPERFQITRLADGYDATAAFDVVEWGAFAQHQLNAGQGLSMRFGLRVDMPVVLGAPETNFEVLDYFGYDTGKLPSGNLLISPRWGFNWQSAGEKRWQVRMGAGMFAGQLPYVWLANAFHNDGARSVTQLCEGRRYVEPTSPFAVPAFVPGSLPTACLSAPMQEVRSAVVIPEDFKYPQDMKFAINADRELSDRLSVTAGVLFSKAINQIGVRELNLDEGSPAPGYERLGGFERRFYDDLDGRWGQVLEVTNDGEDWATSFSLEMRGRVADRLNAQVAYAYSRSWDRMSLQFADMASNFGFNPVENEADDPALTRSNFDRPHKIVVALFGTPFPGLDDTELSVLYTGESGLPFSYVYDLDVNGDGYPGQGGAFERYNDLLHIPANGFDLPAPIGTQILMSRAIESDPCLKEHVGTIMDRNSCRAPWQNNLDLRLAQTLRFG